VFERIGSIHANIHQILNPPGISKVRSIKQPIRSCVQTRKVLRSQCATLRAVIKQPHTDLENAIASTAETLRKSYKEALILRIVISDQIIRNSVVLMYTNPTGTVKLWEAWGRLGMACNEVRELLKAVAKPEATADSAATR
jgi:hypothetical protein